MTTYSVRLESREDLERDKQEMRAQRWSLLRVTAVTEDALIATFIKKAETLVRGGNQITGHEPGT